MGRWSYYANSRLIVGWTVISSSYSDPARLLAFWLYKRQGSKNGH